MARGTRATKFLDQAGVPFRLHTYEYDPTAPSIGMAAAAALGEAPEHVFKTLMTLVDGRPSCVIAPSSRDVSMKKLAAALGAKSAVMMKPEDAERKTGFKIGGISPFGQLRPTPTIMDESALRYDFIYLNGGQRGLQIKLSPHDAAKLLGAVVADVTA